MSAHTPGPWVALRRDDKWGIYEPEERGEIVIAWVEVSNPGFSHPRDAADAKLIAAAPDLLAALNTILPWADAWHRIGEERHVPLPLLWRGIDEARAAIAKATGGGK